MQLRVTSLPGDGIGPEVISQAVCVLEEVASGFGHDLELDEKEIGGAALEKFGNPLPDATVKACLASQAVLLGAVGSPANFDRRRGCCAFARNSEPSPICALRCFIPCSLPAHRFAKKSSKGRTF